MPDGKIIIAHRGASLQYAENTPEAFEGGHRAGADLIETDVVLTRDGVAICLHDLWLETTTDASARYPERARADGHWYALDFDLSEVQSLIARGRGGVGEGRVPTFDDLLGLVDRLNRESGRSVGVIVEPKDPGFHKAEGRRLEDALLGVARDSGWLDGRMIVQSFGDESLVYCASVADVPLVALTKEPLSVERLDRLTGRVVGIGPERTVAARDGAALVRGAHDRGLGVYPYTFRDEPDEVRRFLFEIGVDGVFTDDPAGGVAVALG